MKKNTPLPALFPSPLAAAAAVISLVSLMVVAPLSADPPSPSNKPVFPIRQGIPPDAEALSLQWRKQEIAVEKIVAPVQQEINRLPHHAWAGAYHRGSLTPEWLYLAPESGFVRVETSCVAPPSPQTGAVEVMPTGKQLGLRLRSGEKHLLPDTLTPVRWGQRHYLIEPTRMKAFCSFANSGGEDGYFLLREGDENKPVSGLPNVPADFRPYLLPHPLEGKVVEVGRPVPMQMKDRFTCEVTVNLGSADGVYKGLGLWSLNASGGWRAILGVRSVDGPHRCRAVAYPNPVDGPLPKVGWTILSTASDKAMTKRR